jgi:diguanylate cyclase (GGDEF)-like protein
MNQRLNVFLASHLALLTLWVGTATPAYSRLTPPSPSASEELAQQPAPDRPDNTIPVAANESRLDYQQAERLLNQLTTLIFIVGSLLGLIISLLLDKTIRDNQRIRLANQELERLANLDGLTQVANRRCFDEHLRQEWARAVREKSCLTLLLCDVDHFKTYNDTYGHGAGDECLRQLAQAIAQTTHRPGDLTARYGGEEFAVILPNTNAAGGIAVAHSIQDAVSQLAQAGLQVSLSIGVASSMPTQERSLSTLVDLSDRALYTAKDRGRNQIVCLEQDANSGSRSEAS